MAQSRASFHTNKMSIHTNKMWILVLFLGVAYCDLPSDPSNILNGIEANLPTIPPLPSLDVEIFKETVEEASNKTVPEVIKEEDYPIESHYVTTPDGYILNLHRIPTGQNGETNDKVAFLQHGLLGSSSHWIIGGARGQSLAYNLADDGYDVWMGNARGNTYSRNHTDLNPDKDSKFWEFSWHEIGNIDLPTMIDYVLEKTGVDGVYYAGHSQGTTSFYVMGSTRPEYNEKIKVSISLAPIAFMNHMTSPLMKIMAFWDKSLTALLDLIGKDEFLPSDGFLSKVSASMCSDGVSQVICKNALFAICGFSNEEMNNTRLATMTVHSPAGSSTKQLLHYAQEIKSGHFRQYDHGPIQNKKTYGSITPPDYDLSKITAPVHLIYSKNDWLSAVVDVEKLCTHLGNCSEMYLVADPNFNHLDYVMGMNATSLVYDHIVDVFTSY